MFIVEMRKGATNKRTHIKREEKLKERGVRQPLCVLKEDSD